MVQRVANGKKIAQQCWQALKQNPQLMVFPLVSGIAIVIISLLFALPLVAIGGNLFVQGKGGGWFITAVIAFIYYFICYTVLIFSNTALVVVSLKLLKGQSATVSDGITVALSRLTQIIGFALISATIGTFAKLSSGDSGSGSDNPILSIVRMIVGGLIQGVWDVVVFFAIPVYVVENLGPINSIRRSWVIFKQTWGEGFSGKVTIWFVSLLVQFVVIFIMVALFVVAVATRATPLLILSILFGITSFCAISLIAGAINGVFQASLYHFAITGETGRFIDKELAVEAFSH